MTENMDGRKGKESATFLLASWDPENWQKGELEALFGYPIISHTAPGFS